MLLKQPKMSHANAIQPTFRPEKGIVSSSGRIEVPCLDVDPTRMGSRTLRNAVETQGALCDWLSSD
jgi:hypothetical protein